MNKKGTAVAVVEERPIVEIVQEGANLSPEEWRPARIAAARALLPEGFQDAPSMIAFLARAQRSGLDPWLGELWAWKDGNRLIFMTGRDGWLSLARSDETIEYVEMGLVFSGDTFGAKKVDGRFLISHEVGIRKQGTEILALMAYAVVHFVAGHSGDLERRTFDDYQHLLGKSNWKQDMNGMLLTRCVSNAVKFATPRGAGLASSAHGSGEAPEASIMADALSGMAETRTESIRKRLEDHKESRKGVELVVDPPQEAVEAPVASPVDRPEDRPAGPPENVEDASPPLTAPDPTTESRSGEKGSGSPTFLCQFCPETGPSARSIGAHGRKHGEEKEIALQLKGHGLEIRRYNDPDADETYFIAYDMASGDRYEPAGVPLGDRDWNKVAGVLLTGLAASEEVVPTPDDSTVVEGEPPENPPREPIKFQHIFELVQKKGLDDSLPKELVNSERWAHVFADQRPDGAEEIQVWDLNDEGKDSLYNIIDQLDS